jgi:bifunctional enzyme CysN/CysC/sulfate adenylyltransferase subunit 1
MLTETIESTAILTGIHPGVQKTDLLRFTTAGSVDDGKSTLIGRLLYDSKALYEDQIASVRKSGINRSGGPMDLSLFTDGLRAEREQGITIDVAYRYFSSPRRKFIIADTPGHEQYTRNMATGASTADAAVILIDATKGLLPQSRRHIYISVLLGIPHVIAAVNKMDLAGYSEQVFHNVATEFEEFCRQLGVRHTFAIPVSALEGENVVERGRKMEWFHGPTLLELLETLPVAHVAESEALRFPVQYVIRPDAAFRGFAGRVSTGTLRRGAPVVALPSGTSTRIKSIVTLDGPLESAGPGSSVTVTLEDEIDLSRGDLLTGVASLPQVSSRFKANLVWMHSSQMQPGKSFLLKHTTRTVRAKITAIEYRVDVNTLSQTQAATLQMNDIASVSIETTQPLHFDAYQHDRTMGSFILIDPLHNATMAAGMITESAGASPEILRHEPVQLKERIVRNGHPPAAVWLVERPELAVALEREIFARGWHCHILSATDFYPHQLKAAARVLRSTGAITLLSVPAEAADRRHEIEAIFGRDYFVEIAPLPEYHSDALSALLRLLDQLQGGTDENWVI